MEGRLLVLHRIIEAVDPSLLPALGDTDEQLAFKHRRVQQVVHLVQAVSGIDLAYHFEWRGVGSDDALRRAFEMKLIGRLKKIGDEIKDIEILLKARLTSGLGRPLDEHEDRMTHGAALNLHEAAWRVQGAFDRLNSLLAKKE